MLSLLEDRWDDLMMFDPQLFGQEEAVPSYTSDPSQKIGIRSTMPKSTPPKKTLNKYRIRNLSLF